MKINYTAIADKVGISVSHANRVLHGQRSATAKVILKMAEVMGMTTDELFRLIERERKKGRRIRRRKLLPGKPVVEDYSSWQK